MLKKTPMLSISGSCHAFFFVFVLNDDGILVIREANSCWLYLSLREGGALLTKRVVFSVVQSWPLKSNSRETPFHSQSSPPLSPVERKKAGKGEGERERERGMATIPMFGCERVSMMICLWALNWISSLMCSSFIYTNTYAYIENYLVRNLILQDSNYISLHNCTTYPITHHNDTAGVFTHTDI